MCAAPAPVPRTPRSLARVVVAAGVLAIGGACQPVDSGVPDPGDQVDVQGDVVETEEALPADLPALLEGLSSTAAEWQDDPVVAEVLVDLDEGAWREATVTYLAPDADRMLVLQRDPSGTRQLRTTLATLDLHPVPAGALEAVPPPPGDLLGPDALVEAAAEAVSACDVGDVDSVLYATGAPAAWDGTTWTESPAWTATISSADRSAVVDPVTGESRPAGCLDAG